MAHRRNPCGRVAVPDFLEAEWGAVMGMIEKMVKRAQNAGQDVRLNAAGHFMMDVSHLQEISLTGLAEFFLSALEEPSAAMIEAGARKCCEGQGSDPDVIWEGLPLWENYVDEPTWAFPVMIRAAKEPSE